MYKWVDVWVSMQATEWMGRWTGVYGRAVSRRNHSLILRIHFELGGRERAMVF